MRVFLPAKFVSYVKKQTLPEINVHAHLFGTLEYTILKLGYYRVD